MPPAVGNAKTGARIAAEKTAGSQGTHQEILVQNSGSHFPQNPICRTPLRRNTRILNKINLPHNVARELRIETSRGRTVPYREGLVPS
jgi:hypothetical protein